MRRLTIPLLALFLASGLAAAFVLPDSSPARAATRTAFNSRVSFQAVLDAGTVSVDGFEQSDGYPAAFAILDAAVINAVFGETDYASTQFSPPNWNFITGSTTDQYYCAGCNGTFRLTFDTATETCGGAVRDGVFGVGFDVRFHSASTRDPIGPYSAFVTYGDGTTENFVLPLGASFFGITSPDYIAEIHVAINNVPTSSGSIGIDNVTLGNAPGGCSGGGPQLPSMDITKTASASTAVAGGNLSYTVTATNDGPVAVENVTIEDILPSSARFSSASPSTGGSCSTPSPGATGGTVQCSWGGPIAPGASVSVSIGVGVCPDAGCGGSLTNVASVSFDAAGFNEETIVGDPREVEVYWVGDMPFTRYVEDDGDSAALGLEIAFATAGMTTSSARPSGVQQTRYTAGPVQVVTPIEAQADLSITKSDSPDPVIAGQTLTYQLDVRNAGPSVAPSVLVTDQLDPLLSFVSATVTPAGPTCSHSGGLVTCDLRAMGTGTECFGSPGSNNYQITIVATVSELAPCSPAQCPGSGAFGAGPLTNTATVAHNDGCTTDPSAANNSATATTDVLAGADVVLDDPVVVRLAAGGGGEPAFAPGAATTDAGLAGLLQDEPCLAAGDILQVTQRFSNTGPNAISRQRDNPGAEYEMVYPPEIVGTNGCRVLSGGGVCSADANGVAWNGEIAVGEAVEVIFFVRIRGGLPVGTQLLLTSRVNYDEFNVGINSASREAVAERALTCEPIIDPNTQLDRQVHLPILNFLGQDDVCETWIEVQNIGCDFAKAALITWGEPGFCPPQAAGPLKVECTGMLKPGSTWNLLGAQVPTGSKSGILFQFTTKQLSEIGVDLGFDDITGDYLCETLFFGVVGDADDYRRFKKAYDEGLEFAGVPLDRAKGDGALAVDVHRTCPGDVTPGVEVTSKYNGIAGTHLGVFDDVFGGYGFYVPLVYADASGFETIMYIQNGGLQCSSVEVWFQEQDACLRASICEILTLAPGESYQLSASDCVGPDFQGSAWLRSSQIMGIAVDVIGRDVLMTYVAEPAEINYTFDPTEAVFSAGNQVAFGPLIYSEYQGWDSGVQVQNLSAVTAAKVKVYFLDRSGDIITTLADWICPRGSQTFFLPVIFDLPGNWVGSVRVESQEWFSPGQPLVAPANIVAIATLMKYDDAARTNTIEALAYNLLPEHKIYDWQIAGGTGGNFESGVGLIALPSLLRDVSQLGLTSEVAIANVVPKPGFTDFAVFIYDQNGLLDYFCQKLNEKQVEYIDLATWGYVNPGFKGSAIISATFWEHDVFDNTGFFLRNVVGLGAVSIERKGRRGYEEDIPGDEAAGSRGIPFASTFDEDGDPIFEFCFMGYAPLCPGLPDLRPDPADCPAEVTASCENCPLAIPMTGTAGMMETALADLDLAANCQIVDVNVTLDLNHTWIGDLTVDLTSPEGTESEMFSAICGNFDNVMAILDDDAATPIGSVCAPLGFASYRTESGTGLDIFDGENPGGTWMLDINDGVGGDAGTLNDFVITAQTRGR